MKALLLLFFTCSLNLPFSCPGKPTCRCPVGFSGPFCEKRICDNYCLNGGTCDITQGNQPVCRCMAEYTGERCLYRESCIHCLVAANTTNWWSGSWPWPQYNWHLSNRRNSHNKAFILIQLCYIKSIEVNALKFTRRVWNKNNPLKYFLSTNITSTSILQINKIKTIKRTFGCFCAEVIMYCIALS